MANVSVIVPIYNVEKYLRRCVDSIISQSLSDIEIILVDDGSPDSCGRICDSYERKDCRIKVIHKKNGGLSEARNAGIHIATGEFITLIDSDDWIEPDMLKDLYSIAVQHHADIVECAVRNIFADRVDEGVQGLTSIVKGNNLFALHELYKWKTFKTIACAKLYKKGLFEDIEYPVGRMHEDEFVTYKLFYKAECSVYVDKAFYNYDRTRESSITGTFKEQNLDVCEAYAERLAFYEKKSLKSLIPEMRNHYFWNILDKLYKCYKWNIYTNRVRNIIANLRENYLNNMEQEISAEYKVKLTILQNSYALFFHSYDNIELQKQILTVLKKECWDEKRNKLLKDLSCCAPVENVDDDKNDQILADCLKEKVYLKGFLNIVNEYEKMIFYGAGKVSQSIYKCFKKNHLEDRVMGFAVSRNMNEKKYIDGKLVKSIQDYVADRDRILVIVAVRDVYCNEILKKLLELQFMHIVIVDTILKNALERRQL